MPTIPTVKNKFNMSKYDFILWLEHNSAFSRESENSDDYWRELVDYVEYVFDTLEVKNDTVIFRWEDWIFGGIDYKHKEYSFDEFSELYKYDKLK